MNDLVENNVGELLMHTVFIFSFLQSSKMGIYIVEKKLSFMLCTS